MSWIGCFELFQFGGDFVDSFTMPGAESQAAVDLLRERFPSQAGDSASLVFQSPTGIDDPAIRARIEDLLATVAALPDVTGVVSPWDRPGAVSAALQARSTRTQRIPAAAIASAC